VLSTERGNEREFAELHVRSETGLGELPMDLLNG
jgi:hypothetical protein